MPVRPTCGDWSSTSDTPTNRPMAGAAPIADRGQVHAREDAEHGEHYVSRGNRCVERLYEAHRDDEHLDSEGGHFSLCIHTSGGSVVPCPRDANRFLPPQWARAQRARACGSPEWPVRSRSPGARVLGSGVESLRVHERRRGCGQRAPAEGSSRHSSRSAGADPPSR